MLIRGFLSIDPTSTGLASAGLDTFPSPPQVHFIPVPTRPRGK